MIRVSVFTRSGSTYPGGFCEPHSNVDGAEVLYLGDDHKRVDLDFRELRQILDHPGEPLQDFRQARESRRRFAADAPASERRPLGATAVAVTCVLLAIQDNVDA